MDLDDDEQEQAAKAKRKLKRRSKKSAKAKNAAGAAPHAPVSAPPGARAAPPEPSTTIAPAATQPVPAPAAAAAPPPRPLPKIRVFPQLSEVQKARLRMKDQEHIRRAARLHAAVTQEQERNAFLERIQAEEVRREQARIAAARPVPPPPNRATGADDDSDGGFEESDNDDPVEDLIHRERIRERDLLRTPGCLALGRKAFRLEDMPRTAPGRAEVHIKELGFHFVDPLAPIAEKEIVPRVRVFIPYLGIEGWISITSRGPALDDGHLIVELKYLQAMHVKNRMLKKCCYTLYLVELADRLRAEASRETLKTARKNVVEFDMVVLAPGASRVIRKFANAIARKAAEARGETFVPTPYDETAVDAVVVTAVPPVAPVVAPEPAPAVAAMDARAARPSFALATLVADGAKKVVFKYQNGKAKAGANGWTTSSRWRGETDRCGSSSRLARDVAAAAADEPPVDRLQRVPDPGLVNLPTIWPRMRLPFRAATPRRRRRRLFPRPAPRSERLERKNRIAGGAAAASGPVVDERFYGISDDRDFMCPAGKFLARATIPGSGKHAIIVFGTYDSKVEVSIQEKHRISEVVVARIEEVNVARAEAEKPLPPLHVQGASRRLERYKADFALQLKDLAYVEAADEACLRDQAAALAPPEPMPDGSRPPIDAHSRRTAASTAAVANFYRDPCGLLEPRALAPPGQPRRVAKLYVVPNGEVVSPPPPPIYHVTENGERLLVLCGVQRPLIPAIQQAAAAAAAAAAAERATRRCPRPRRRSQRRARAPAEALAEAPPTAPPVEAPAEAPPTAAAPAKKKKKKRSRRAAAQPAEISEYGARACATSRPATRALARPHPPAAGGRRRPRALVVVRAREDPRLFAFAPSTRALPQAQS
ncbi:hypothetical protein JL721_171 [Aureococcus anophagefferens]|nr:hypothetical protein JL721_171 [Aureococcus anophagefferens]